MALEGLLGLGFCLLTWGRNVLGPAQACYSLRGAEPRRPFPGPVSRSLALPLSLSPALPLSRSPALPLSRSLARSLARSRARSLALALSALLRDDANIFSGNQFWLQTAGIQRGRNFIQYDSAKYEPDQ